MATTLADAASSRSSATSTANTGAPALPFSVTVRVLDLLTPGKHRDVQLMCAPAATVKWLALAACAQCCGDSGAPVPSSVVDVSSGRELPPGARVWDACCPGGALPAPGAPVAVVTPAAPLGLELPSVSLRAVPTSPLPSPAPGALPRPEEEAAILLRTQPQRSLWASCAFSVSPATHAAAAALVASEAATAEAVASTNASRTESGLQSLMVKEFKRGADIMAECGHDTSLATVEFAIDALLPFVRVTHMLADGGEGPAGETDRRLLRQVVVAHYGEFVDVFRHFCVADEPRDGKEVKEGDDDGGSSARPLNKGENGGPLGMAFDVRAARHFPQRAHTPSPPPLGALALTRAPKLLPPLSLRPLCRTSSPFARRCSCSPRRCPDPPLKPPSAPPTTTGSASAAWAATTWMSAPSAFGSFWRRWCLLRRRRLRAKRWRRRARTRRWACWAG